jgi:chromosome segregation ATPase
VLIGQARVLAIDDAGAKSEFNLTDHSRSSVESADEYSDAVQHLHDADADVVRAREQGMKDLQSSPEYAAAVRELDSAYAAFNDRKNALLADLEKKDPRCAPMKKQVAEIDAEIDTARQNPATTTDKFEELYKNRATFVHQWEDELDGAIKRENLEPLRQQWQAASDKLAGLRDQQRADVENADKLKSAKAVAIVAHAAVDQARAALDGPPPAEDAQEDQADDYLRRFPRFGFGGNDAWWTYGWSPIYGGGAAKPAPAK